MSITVWGRATSSNVQIVMWTLAELGLLDRTTRLDVGHSYGGVDTPEYLAMNPNGRVPVLRDGDGTALFESGAIVRYLCARYGAPAFWPADPAARAPLDMWCEWVKVTLGAAFTSGIFMPYRARHDPAPADVEEVNRLAAILDARIGDGPWMTGKTFGLADLFAGHLMYRFHTLPFDRAPQANLAAYYDRLQARPAFVEHVMVDYSGLRVPEG
ncbi:MAG: glutathione S-transferase family protein [Pseudomonadota bacterium]